MRCYAVGLTISSFLLLTGCFDRNKDQEVPRTTMVLEEIANYSFPITTNSPKAQQFFNEGMALAYGFNHLEAARSFQAAAKLDPNAPMPYWGQAYVLGPNINLPMDPANEPKALELVSKAEKVSGQATEKEKDLIQALKKRYSSSNIQDRTSLDKEWANETEKLIEKYPDDVDIATLRAESLMLLRPWDYWTKEKNPYPETEETVTVLEKAIHNNPNHFGALHYYIHIMEASTTPEKAEPVADKLRDLNIQTGHLLHMPAHIYMRLGRYDDAIAANKHAVAADEKYIEEAIAKGSYPSLYYPHNSHFLSWAYMIQGRKKEAVEAANKIAALANPQELKTKTYLNSFAVVPYFVLVRFGMWDEILELPEPPKEQSYIRALWLYARGMALANTNAIDEAEVALEELKEIAKDPNLQTISLLSHNKAGPILNLAVEALSGEIEVEEGDVNGAIANFETGITLEDELTYNEPPDWMIPMRQAYGQAHLVWNDPVKAEELFREDLKRHPKNGWALYGLYQSLKRQGKQAEAATVRKELDAAWSKADNYTVQNGQG